MHLISSCIEPGHLGASLCAVPSVTSDLAITVYLTIRTVFGLAIAGMGSCQRRCFG